MSLIKKPHELGANVLIKALIYGQPGVRKTTFSLSAPDPLLLDFDNGAYRLDPRHQVNTVPIDRWSDVTALLKEDLSAYKTIVIDTAGKLLDFMTMHIVSENPKAGNRDGNLTIQGYGTRKHLFLSFLRQVSALNKHIVFVAHEREEKEGEQKIIRPDIGGSSGGDLIRELDLVGYMQSIVTKKVISFEPCEKFYGKNTCRLEPFIEIISTLETGAPNNQLANIFDKFKQSQLDRAKIHVAYSELMELIIEKAICIDDASTANEVSAWAQDFEGHIWDSKLQAALRISQKTKEIGLVFNKVTKKYEGGGHV